MTTMTLRHAAMVMSVFTKPFAARIQGKMEAQDLKILYRELESQPKPETSELLAALDALQHDVQVRHKKGLQLPERQARSCGQDSKKSPKKEVGDETSLTFLTEVAPHQIFQVVCDEHPQIVANIVSRLPTELAADVLKKFQGPQKVAIMRRLCMQGGDSPVLTANLVGSLRERLSEVMAESSQAGGVLTAARILQCFPPSEQENLMEELSCHDSTIPARLDRALLRFSDLESFCNRDLRLLLQHADTSWWAPALQSASLEVRHRVLSNMANQPAKFLMHEISQLQCLPFAEIRSAQQKILGLCGRLRLPSSAFEASDVVGLTATAS